MYPRRAMEGGGGGCPPCRGTPDRVEQWLSGKETPELLRGLVMGETLGVGSFGEVRVGTPPSGEHCAVKVMDPRSSRAPRSGCATRSTRSPPAPARHPVLRHDRGRCTSRWCNDEYCGCLVRCGRRQQVRPHGPATRAPEQRDTVAIVQELAAGGDLVSLLFTSLGYRMDDIIPRSYFHQLLEGIAYCHSQKVCHTKPEPLSHSSAKLKIVDFGLCRARFLDAGRGGPGWGLAGRRRLWQPHHPAATPPQRSTRRTSSTARRRTSVLWRRALHDRARGSFEYSDGGPAAIQDGTFPWPSSMDSELRNLITVMLDPRPSSRWTIDQIRCHPWYERPQMTQKELTLHMADHMQSAWRSRRSMSWSSRGFAAAGACRPSPRRARSWPGGAQL